VNNQPWVKIYDEAWDDSIVGNREGLLALKNTIDEALKNECIEIKDKFKSDFGVVALSQLDWDSSDVESNEGIWGYLIGFILFVWMVALPIYAIYKLVM
jgi:hypothetical protein